MQTIYIVMYGEGRENIRAFSALSAAQRFLDKEVRREQVEHDFWERHHEANGHRPNGFYPYFSKWRIEELDLEAQEIEGL